MYLVDTNIFLEILLNDPNRETCETFLDANIYNLYISDFSLHSIGVILFGRNKSESYKRFVCDVMPRITLVTIPTSFYLCLINSRATYHFDFDDAYQYCVAKYQGLILKTQDHHFDYVTDVQVEYL
jgi:predicted nucleic acid-binding protein